MWFALLRRFASLPPRALKAAGRGVRASARAVRTPAGRLGVQCAVTALALGGALAAGYFAVPSAGPAWSYGAEPEAEPEERPLLLNPEDAPAPGLPADTDQAGDDLDPTDAAAEEAAEDLDAWAQHLSALGIPPRALVAYGRAELVSAAQNPGCNLSWTTLAGIGATETGHGTTDGNRIQSDGTTLTPIIGPEYEEMGPMQFLPSTWQDWAADGNGDGQADPHNIDDAAIAAANYLCHADRDLTVPADWYEAVHSYNPVEDYVERVYGRADDYGRQSAE